MGYIVGAACLSEISYHSSKILRKSKDQSNNHLRISLMVCERTCTASSKVDTGRRHSYYYTVAFNLSGF